MRVTTWAEYGVIIALHLAKQGERLPVPARQLADDEQLPSDYVEQILLRLRRAGLIESVRGAKGGYRLARLPFEISIREVVEAAELHTFEVNCEKHPVSAARCNPVNPCSIRPVWRAVQRRVDEVLDSVTLADLMHEEWEVAGHMGLQASVI